MKTKTNNNKSLLVGALLCTLGAALIYLFKWAKFYFMTASIWQVAETCGNLGKYWGMDGYSALSYFIYGGAVLVLFFLIRDAYKIAKPLMNDINDVKSARSSGAGRIISILFTIVFIILIYSLNDGDLADSSITMWPVISMALCIVAKVMIGQLDITAVGAENRYFTIDDEAAKPLEPAPAILSQNDTTNRNTEDVTAIPVINYSAESMLQPCQILCAKDGCGAQLLIACYTNPRFLQAMKAKVSFTDVFGETIDAGEVFFREFKEVSMGERKYLKTEGVEIETLRRHLREITAARVVIDRIKSIENRISVPSDYQDSLLSIDKLTEVKRGSSRDAVCEKRFYENVWICTCGKKNYNGALRCSRCRRSQNESSYDTILEALDSANDYDSIITILDNAIYSGMDELKKIKADCIKIRAIYGFSDLAFLDDVKRHIRMLDKK